MSDLARRRSARDLWISRSHVAIGAVGVVLIAAFSFGMGVMTGKSSVDMPASIARPLSAELPNNELVELLARVEATAEMGGEVEVLTFPDALTNSPAGSAVDVSARPEGRFSIEVARFQDVGRARPVRDHLRESGQKAWIAVELVGGEMTYRVAVGGFDGQAGAEGAVLVVADALANFPGGQFQPKVIEH